MVDYTTKTYKEEQVERLSGIDLERYGLASIDVRLYDYVREVQQHGDDHNVFEVLAVLKFLRLMESYEFDKERVRKFVKLYESLKFSGMDGRRSYRLTAVQYFQFASILGFVRWEGVDGGDRDYSFDSSYSDYSDYSSDGLDGDDRPCGKLTKVQGRRYSDERGRMWEKRRLVREAILFVPRKFSKTTSTAALAVDELLFGDANAQAYTAANSYKQAKICFDEISKILRQLDGKKRYFKATRETVKWRANKFNKESTVECLSGGADTKDGLNASLVVFDEYAQAKYVKDHSEGAELLQVLRSSMGTRREPLTMIITTASRVEDGPFAMELENAKRVLTGDYEDDTQFASLFMPDAWEMDADSMGSEKVWKKCNPHIGVTVQKGFYADQWKKAQRDAEQLIEFKTKLLNVFVSGGVKDWIPLQLAQKLQVDWVPGRGKGKPMAMAAIDLSVADDFSTVVYSAYSEVQKKFYLHGEFFIPEETLEWHQNRELYKIWVAHGWLKVCKGAVIDAADVVQNVLEMSKKLRIMQIGYDAYKAQEVVNALAAAVQGLGNRPEDVLKAVPQTYGAFTSPVESFEMAAKMEPPRVAMGMNPILPYCFANCYLDEDRMRNKKPIKRKENLKIDGAVAALMTMWLWNNWER